MNGRNSSSKVAWLGVLPKLAPCCSHKLYAVFQNVTNSLPMLKCFVREYRILSMAKMGKSIQKSAALVLGWYYIVQLQICWHPRMSYCDEWTWFWCKINAIKHHWGFHIYFDGVLSPRVRYTKRWILGEVHVAPLSLEGTISLRCSNREPIKKA